MAPGAQTSSSASSALGRLALATVLSLLAGVLLAGLAFPVVGGLGLLGKSAADELTPQKPPTVSLSRRSQILDRNGHVMATLFSENRVPIKLGDVPDLARKALIAIEDNRFYEHRGIDVKGTLRALAHNSSSGSTQGGSTLTQQYVKNLRIESANTAEAKKAAKEQSVERKLQEARYALWIEQHQTKDEILEGYLNIAYYGSGVYGIGAAAAHYYSVPVAKLTLQQGAMLAGMVQSPNRYDPTINPRSARSRRNTVLARMAELSYITPAQRDVAIHEPVGLKITTTKSGCEAPGIRAPFFCDYIRRYLEDGPAGEVLGKDRQTRQQRLLSGGLTIKTTLDPVVQQSAQRAVDQQVPPNDPFRAVAVADVLEPGTGEVRAMAVNRAFGDKPGQTKVNFAIGGSLGFQAGSTFKAFILARALQLGIEPSLTLYAPQKYCSKIFKNGNEPYCPQNAGDSEAGTFDMVRATWASVNTYFIQLEERTGLATPPALAEALGVRRVDGTFRGASLPRTNASFVLGTTEISPLAMAGAYAAFVSHGVFCPPRPVTEILDADNKPLDLAPQACSQVLEPKVADTMAAILRGVIDGKSSHTGGGASIGRPAAGKTGTTNDSTAAWFVGFTPQLSTAVWLGKATPTPMRRVTINGRFYKQVYGGTIPAAIWRQTMLGALEGVPVEPLPTVALPMGRVATTPAPDVTGLPISIAEDQLRALGYGVVTGAAVNAGPIPVGYVGQTVPAPGAPVVKGATITLLPSNGLAPVPTVTPGASPSPTGAPSPTPNRSPSPTPSPAPRPTKKPRG